jgi:hypothetical protein
MASTEPLTGSDKGGLIVNNEQTPANEVTVTPPVAPAESSAAEAVGNQPAVDGNIAEPSNDVARPNRAERRIQRLNSTIKELSAQNEANLEPVAPLSAAQLPNYDDMDEIDPAQVQRDVLTAAELIAEAKVRKVIAERDQSAQSKARIDALDADMEYVESTYSALNPDSDEFNQDLYEEVTEMYKEASDNGKRDVRLKSFIDRQMKIAGIQANKRQTQQNEAIARQAANSAITPSGEKSVEKPFEQLTLAEKRAKLGYARP